MSNKDNILCDLGAERALLSVLVQKGSDAFYDIADIVGCGSFTNETSQSIFKCIETIIERKQEIDIPTLIAQAEELNLSRLVCKENHHLEYLRSLFAFPVSDFNTRSHAQKLAKLEIAREARIKHLEAISELSKVTGNESIDGIVSISEKPIFDLVAKLNQGRENTPTKIGDKVDEYFDFLDNNECVSTGVPTPFPIWNEVVGGGIRRGGVSLFISRPKVGKSTIAINTALFVSKKNMPVLYLDTEMTLEEQMPRLVANITSTEVSDVEKGRTKAAKKEQVKELLNNSPFFHKVVAGKPFEEILSIIRRWILQDVGYDENGRVKDCLVIYDYFKIMDTSELDNLQEFQAIGFQIGKLVDFCKEYDFPCMAFTQVNRDGITKETSDIISQSDRLLWLCQSATLFKRKTEEEILEDGKDHGNIKFKTLECRFGPGLEDNNYINVNSTGATFQMREINTRYDVIRETEIDESGFGKTNTIETEF